METETIQLPPVTTGIALSMGAIQLLSHCVANCPLTEQQRAGLNNELAKAIKTAVEAMEPKAPHRLGDPQPMERMPLSNGDTPCP